ncbi:MAG: lipopolysaccharide biosynthesis protein [Steroidobacteraceae bacterium]
MWVGASNLIGSILNGARSIVLARLLTPDMFGLMGLAGIAIRAIETVTRPGVSQALIARQSGFDEAASTAFTMLVLRGLLLAVILAAAAPWVAAFYEADVLQPMLQVLAAVFVIGGLANISTIARQKDLDFRQLTYLGLATSIAGTIVTIVAAFWLRSVWALVIGQLATSGVNSLLSYFFIGGRPRLGWNREIARELLAYGKFITGSSIVLFIAMELDSAVIGKLLGIEQLGFYTLAFTIANIATANLSKMASNIMMPAYSKLQDDRPALQRAYLRTLSLVMFIVLPASAGLLLAAEPLLVVVYGGKWLPAVLPLQILAVFGLMRALAAFSGYMFEGIGLPKVAFQLGLMRLTVIAPLIVPVTKALGLRGAAITVTTGMAVQWIAGLLYVRRHLGVSVTRSLAACWRAAWTTALMGTAIFGLMRLIPYNTLWGFATVVLVGVAAYGLLNFRFIKELMRQRFT